MIPSYILAAFLVTLYYKLYVGILEDTKFSLEWLFFFPSVFLYDLLFFATIYWMKLIADSRNVVFVVRCLLLFLIFMIAVGYIVSLTVANTYLCVSGAVVNFGLLGTVSQDPAAFYPMLMVQAPYAISFIAAFLAVFCISHCCITRSRGIGSLPLTVRNLFKYLMLVSALLAYLLVVYLYRPMDPWDLIAKNTLVEMIEAPLRVEMPDEKCFGQAIGKIKPPLDLVDFTHYTSSKTNPLFIQPGQSEKVDNFDFIKRTNDSDIKNVVWIFIESARSDVWPMNYNADFAGKVLTPEALKLKNITPFYDTFVKKGAVVEGGTTAAGYTIKALLSGLCSMSPIPADWSIEAKHEYYKTCLPRLLSEKGFQSKYFQASDAGFDDQDKVLDKAGFEVFAKKNIDNGELNKFNVTPETVNYFGYQDEILIPKMMEFVEENQSKDTPYFLSILTNVNHHPYGTPSTWPMQHFSDEEEYNKVFNSIAYVDRFLENLMGQLRLRDPKNETLYVLTADHGHSYTEHSTFGTTNVGYEQAYRIPMMLYSENKKLKPILTGQTLKGNYQNKDIVPTILDVLNDRNFDPDVRLEYGYEGDSLLHAYRSRPTLSFANPGFSSLTYREHGFKLLFKPNSCKFVTYDLIQDPEEEHPIISKNKTVKQWEKYAKNRMQFEIQRVRTAYKFQKPESSSFSSYPIVFCASVVIFLLYIINRLFDRFHGYKPVKSIITVIE